MGACAKQLTSFVECLNASYIMRNCRTKTEMKHERNIRRTLTTETRQHLKVAEKAENKFVVKVGKEI